MDEINDSEQSDNKRSNVEKNILNHIKTSRYGLNISQIAKELRLSRNTVKANVELLEKEGTILIKQIGKSRICYYRKYFGRDAIFRPFLLQFFNQLLDSFAETMKSQIKDSDSEKIIKNISKDFGKNYDLPPFQLLNLDKESKIQDFSINKVSETLVQFFNILDALSIQFEAEIIPAEVDSSRTIRLQLFSDEFGRSILFYHMVAGYLESKLNIKYDKKMSLDVFEFREESSICYFRLNIED